jgi:multimeric flavodoxin WrbA
MRIAVLNGSPKTDANSVSMHYVKYLTRLMPQVDFEPTNVANEVNNLERDNKKFEQVIARIESADGVLWCFPLYYLLVSAQMKRFIELVFERNAGAAFKAKPTAALATSIHFCDNFALNYVREISDDLGMNYYDHYSAAMDDLTIATERARLHIFANGFIEFIKAGIITAHQSLPLTYERKKLEFSEVGTKVIQTSQKTIILSDASEQDTNLNQMIGFVRQQFDNRLEVINLHDIKILGGCVGCIHCGYDFTCVYDAKDDYRKLWETKLKQADIIIFAGSIKDRYLSAKWKQFFDRSFFHNHAPLLAGKQIGMIISGPFRQMENLKNIFKSYFEFQKANLSGIVSDDYAEPEMIVQDLLNLSKKLVWGAEQGYFAPLTFLGVAGHKIFRDILYSRLRFPFIKDFQSFKRSECFDFPQKNLKSILLSNIMILLTRIPKLRKEIYTKHLVGGMTQPLKKAIDRTGKTDA